MKKIKLAIPLGILLLVSGCKNDSQDILKSEPETNDSYSATFDSSTNTLNSDEVDEKVEEEKQVTPEEEIAKLISDMGYDDNNKYNLSYEDLNEDGISEIFITDLENACSNESIYTYYDGKLNILDEWEGAGFGIICNIDNSPYFLRTAGSSYAQYDDICAITDGQLEVVASIGVSNIAESMDEEFEPEYKAYIGDSEVSVEEYNNYIHKILPADYFDADEM